MKKRGLYIFFIIVLSLILIPLINAQPPFQQESGITQGLTLRYPPINVLKEGRDISAHVHVYNSSNGLLLTNSSVDCFAHVYNSTGNHIIEEEMGFDDNGLDFELNILGGNFTTGKYSFLIWCNSSTEGGFVSGPLEVTPTGTTLETSESLLYIVILIVTFILFLSFLYPAIKLPYSNKTNPDGSITRITRAKYLKLLSVWFAYGFFMWFLQTLNAISKSFITLTYLSNFITNIFTYSQWFSIGITFLILIIIFIEIWKDIILSKTIKRYGKAFLDGRLQ